MALALFLLLSMPPDPTEDDPTGRINLVTPTLGGLQLWTDELYFHGWHIQRHCYTGHCRLLDAGNMRHAWGTFEECREALARVRREQNLPPMQGKVVIAVHGLIRTGGSLRKVCDYLHDRGGYTAISMNYSSTRAEVAQHARALKSIIDNFDGVEQIDLVSHSLGSLVIRHYLSDTTNPQTNRQGDPRIKRIVMYAPPNQGAELAEKLGRNQVFKMVFGAAGKQLARDWPELEKHLAVPQCEFGVIAGGRGDDKGWNPLLTGDDDGVVSVETTRLPGAVDSMVVPASHTFIMISPQVLECTLRFFEHGYFLSPEQRRPLRREPEAGNPAGTNLE